MMWAGSVRCLYFSVISLVTEKRIWAPLAASMAIPSCGSSTGWNTLNIRLLKKDKGKRLPRSNDHIRSTGRGMVRRISRICFLISLLYSQRCLLYTSDAADDLLCVDLGGR